MDRVYFETKIIADDAGAISGIAWKFGQPDRIGDVIEPGAFKGAKLPLPMLFGHDVDDPVGTWDIATEKGDSFHITGKLLVNDVARAREVQALVKSGAVRGLSIGFVTRKAKARKGGGRTISDLELLEASLVTIPMHPGARVTSAKSAVQALRVVDAINRARTDLKYNPDQPRDENGRWGSGGASSLDSQGAVGRAIISAQIGHSHAGLRGAALGAALAVYVDSGAARELSGTAIGKFGYSVLPEWAKQLMWDLVKPSVTVRVRKTDIPPEAWDRFLSSLSDTDAKRLATDIIAALSENEKSQVLAGLASKSSQKSGKAVMAALAINRATMSLTQELQNEERC